MQITTMRRAEASLPVLIPRSSDVLRVKPIPEPYALLQGLKSAKRKGSAPNIESIGSGPSERSMH